jgi:hypothetical protein
MNGKIKELEQQLTSCLRGKGNRILMSRELSWYFGTKTAHLLAEERRQGSSQLLDF